MTVGLCTCYNINKVQMAVLTRHKIETSQGMLFMSVILGYHILLINMMIFASIGTVMKINNAIWSRHQHQYHNYESC